MAAPRLIIATDNAQDASLFVFHRDLELAPKWAAFADDPVKVAAIPAGQKCIGYWSRPGGQISATELAWQDRRQRPDFVAGLTAEEFDKLAAWSSRPPSEKPLSDPETKPAERAPPPSSKWK